VQAGGVVGVGVAELDDEVMGLEVQDGVGECFGDYEVLWDLAGESLLSEGRYRLR
jgi:hypothetical protein